MSMDVVIRGYLPPRQKAASARALIPASTESESEVNVVLTWTAKTEAILRETPAIYMSSAGTHWPSEWREVGRGTHTERVENPDDPEQYIEVEVVDWIAWKRADAKDGTEVKYTYGNAANAPSNPNF